MEEKVKIMKKKVKIETDFGILSAVVGFAMVLTIIGVLWFAEAYADWRKTHEWQVPFRSLIKEIKPEEAQVISLISGLPISEEQRIMNNYPLAPLIKSIYVLESTEGKNDGCKDKGKFNGFGYAQSNHTWQCFDSFEQVTKAVNDWYVERLGTNGNDVVEALCYYNLGVAGQSTCVYSQNFMSVIIKKS